MFPFHWLAAAVSMVTLAAGTVAVAQPTQPSSQPLLHAGRLLRVDGAHLVIQRAGRPADAEPVIVPTDENTQCMIDLERVELADLKPGMELTVRREARSAEEPDPKLYVHGWSPGSAGTVVRVEPRRLVLSVPGAGAGAQSSSVVVETNAGTKVHFPIGGGAYANADVVGADQLKPGMRVKVVPPEGAARRIFVRPTTKPVAK